MSNLSDLLPSGAGGKSFNFVASGTLANGQTVGLRSDGKVEAITGVTQAIGTPAVFETGGTQYVASAYDVNAQRVVVAYRDQGNSEYGTAVVGTVSGNAITFGTPVVFESALMYYNSIVYDANAQKVVISFHDYPSAGASIVGTVSGTSISFGSKTAFVSSACEYISSSFDSVNNKVIIAFKTASGINKGTAVVGTVSGTSISFGSTVYFDASTVYETNCVFDVNAQKTVIFYRASNNYGTAIVGTVSGTSISFGTAVVFQSSTAQGFQQCAVYDANAQKVVFIYKYNASNNGGSAIVGTVSGTSISFGTAVVFDAGNINYPTAVYDSSINKVVIGYQISSQGTFIVGTVSGTSISFGTTAVYESGSVEWVAGAYDSTNNKVVFSYSDDGNSQKGTGVVCQIGSTNASSFIGITEAAIANAATGAVTLQGGINTTAITNTAITTFAITVANPGSGNKYYIDGALQATVSLSEGRTYKFDQSDGTNGGHPLRFSTTSDGTHGGGSEYTTGVTVVGVPGNAGAYTQIVVAIGAPTLYYYCTVHSGMGGTANTPDDARFTVGSTYYVQDDGTLGTGSTSIEAGEALSATSINLVNT